MPQVEVQGPDGNTYHFPDGTTKESAVAYFKKKGIGVKYAPYKPPSENLLKSRKKASKQDFESNLPQSTILSRSREAAIGALEPFTANSLLSTLRTASTAINEMIHPTAEHPYYGQSPTGVELLEGLVKAPIAPIQNIYQGIRTGDYDRAAYGAGGVMSQTAPAVAGAVESAVGPVKVGPEIPGIGDLRARARSIAQRATGQTAADTTAKIFDKYAKETAAIPEKQKAAQEEAAAKTAEKQARENERVANRNKHGALAARNKNKTAQVKYQSEVKTAEQEAASRTQQQEAAFDKAKKFQVDSKRFGELTNDLNDKLKIESDENYSPVNEATASDEGETLVDQARQAKELLKGSSENIKQFREVLRGTEGESFMSAEGGAFDQAKGHPLERILEGEDPLADKEPQKYKFDDIQGYKQELDQKLGAGNLLPDVYLALKSFRDSLSEAARTIADRNGVGQQLQKANKFYADWKQLFSDTIRNESAIGDVLNRVKRRTTDPEFYHEPITKGKASGVAIERLRNLATRHSAEAHALADMAKMLRDRYNVGDKPPVYLGEKPVPVSPADVTPPKPVGTSPAGPRTVPSVEPRKVAIPEEPNIGDILKNRSEDVGQTGRNMQKINAYDLRRIGLPVFGGLLAGHPLAGLVTGLGIEAMTKGVGYALDIDKVKQFIAGPTESDLVAAEKLPEPARSNVVNGLRAIIDQEKAAGRPVPVAPSVKRLITNTGNLSSPVQNRREALERLGR